MTLLSQQTLPPVIVLTGPSASGKSTVGERIAQILSFTHLSSGSLFRLVALLAQRSSIQLHSNKSWLAFMPEIRSATLGSKVLLSSGEDVTDELASDACSELTSQIATIPAVRSMLREYRISFRKFPGHVEDGRDVIFEGAHRFHITADTYTRALRRLKQLRTKKPDLYSLDQVYKNLAARDTSDERRAADAGEAPPTQNVIDTARMTIDEAVNSVIRAYNRSLVATF